MFGRYPRIANADPLEVAYDRLAGAFLNAALLIGELEALAETYDWLVTGLALLVPEDWMHDALREAS